MIKVQSLRRIGKEEENVEEEEEEDDDEDVEEKEGTDFQKNERGSTRVCTVETMEFPFRIMGITSP